MLPPPWTGPPAPSLQRRRHQNHPTRRTIFAFALLLRSFQIIDGHVRVLTDVEDVSSLPLSKHGYPGQPLVTAGRALRQSFGAVPCNTATMGELPVFYDFNTSDTSAQGDLPRSGSCIQWTLNLDQGQQQCASNGTILIELWIIVDGVPLRAETASVVLMAHTIKAPSIVISPGRISISPYNIYQPGNTPLLNNTYIDITGTDNILPYQRILVPAGVLASASTTPIPYFITMVGRQSLPSSYDYALRATCMPAAQLPCPRPAPNLGACNTPFSNHPVPQCRTPNSADFSIKGCACEPGWSDPACGTPVSSLNSQNGVWQQLRPSGMTWTYYSLTAATTNETRMLVELLKPSGNLIMYQAAVVVLTSELPMLVDIDYSVFNIRSNCTCRGCYCDMPTQAPDLLYQSQLQPAGSSGLPVTWYIGIYSNAPRGLSVANASPLQLRVRWTSSAQTAPPLCPLDCSNMGNCNLPSPYSVVMDSSNRASYSCTCRPGFGGPYCQGPLQQLGPSNSDTGRVSLAPAEWSFYQVPGLMLSSPTSLAFVVEQSTPTMLLVLSPIYIFSTGRQFFQSYQTWVFNNTVQLVTMPQVPTGAIGWMLTVINSDAIVATQGSFQLMISAQTNSQGISFTALLQMALIGSVSGLAILFLCFLVMRVVILRRGLLRRGLALSMAENEMMQEMAASMPVVRGVPSHTVRTFPVFHYDPMTFVEMRAQGRQQAVEGIARAVGAARKTSGAPDPSRQQRLRPLDANAECMGDVVSDADDRQCSVCICDYEQGDELRQLPCGHVFHTSCIDPWMMQHNTCPNCRWRLCAANMFNGRANAAAQAAADAQAEADAHELRYRRAMMLRNQVLPASAAGMTHIPGPGPTTLHLSSMGTETVLPTAVPMAPLDVHRNEGTLRQAGGATHPEAASTPGSAVPSQPPGTAEVLLGPELVHLEGAVSPRPAGLAASTSESGPCNPPSAAAAALQPPSPLETNRNSGLATARSTELGSG